MANSTVLSITLLIAVLLSLTAIQSRKISFDSEENSLISDGVSSSIRSPRRLPSFLRLGAAEEACEETYGFLPCTMTVMGNLFLLIVYGYLMFTAATFLSNGSEILLAILGPGIVGGLFLPILGALPDAILILVSGLSGNKEVAQEQVLIGMGLLAGSTVMLLTVLWGSCVIVGKCDLSEDNKTAIDLQNNKKFSLCGSGVTTDKQTSYASRIMVISIIPFVITQLPKILNSKSGNHLSVLVALILSVALLISYCVYQIYQPWIQRRRIAYVKHKHVISGFLKHVTDVHVAPFGKLLNDDGSLNIQIIEKLFDKLDENSDNFISKNELTALIIGIQFDKMDLDSDDATEKVMKEFDTSGDNRIDRNEFIEGFKKWLHVAKKSSTPSGIFSKRLFHDFHHRTSQEHEHLINENDDDSDKEDESADNSSTWMTIQAVSFLIIGAIIAAVFADPLVDSVNNFSSVTKIPSFFISFIAMPFATNSSEAVSALIFASRKKKRTASLTFSEIYGAVTMNNTLCLAVFLGLVYIRGLTWDFSSEVLVILIVCVVMGIFTSFQTTFPVWTSSVAYILYPLSLILIYVLDFIYGWS